MTLCVLVKLGGKCAVSTSFCGRCHTGVSGRNRIEKDADSQARGIRGEGRHGGIWWLRKQNSLLRVEKEIKEIVRPEMGAENKCEFWAGFFSVEG